MSVEFCPLNDQTQWGVLANGYSSPFADSENKYNSVEQFMMYKKASLFSGNTEVMTEILNETEYERIKALGRKVQNFDPDVWNANSYSIVKLGCTKKFEQNPKLLGTLLSTCDKDIRQINLNDKIWSYPGDNKLGKILEDVRSEFYKKILL